MAGVALVPVVLRHEDNSVCLTIPGGVIIGDQDVVEGAGSCGCGQCQVAQQIVPGKGELHDVELGTLVCLLDDSGTLHIKFAGA